MKIQEKFTSAIKAKESPQEGRQRHLSIREPFWGLLMFVTAAVGTNLQAEHQTRCKLLLFSALLIAGCEGVGSGTISFTAPAVPEETSPGVADPDASDPFSAQSGATIEGGVALLASTELDSLVAAAFKATAKIPQRLEFGLAGELKGSGVTVQPGTFTNDGALVIEAVSDLADSDFINKVGIAGTIKASGVAVEVNASDKGRLAEPAIVSLPIPKAMGLVGDLSIDGLTIVYERINSQGLSVVGAIPKKDVTIEGDKVLFATESFGTFQALILDGGISARLELPYKHKRNRHRHSGRFGGKDKDRISGGDDKNKDGLSAENIKKGITIAGVEGTYEGNLPALCSFDGELNCLTSAAFPSVDSLTVTPEKILLGESIAGVGGQALARPADCSSTILESCVATANFPAVNTAAIDSSSIRIGRTVAGVAGTFDPSVPLCSADGQTACLSNASYKAVDLSKLTPENIKKSVVIAGISGDYPSATNPLSGSTATTDLPSLNATMAVGDYEYFDSAGNRFTGSIADGGTVIPAVADQTVAAAGTVYRSVTVAGDADLTPNNIAAGITLFAVAGSAALRPNDCAADGATDCVAVPNYPAVNKAAKLVPGNFKSGIVIAGITGAYPSLAYPLASATATADLPPLDKNMTPGAYEYFDSSGTRYTGTVADGGTVTPSTLNQSVATTGTVYRSITVAGDADLVPSKISIGTKLFNIDGSAPIRPADCNSDGGLECVTVANYPAVDKATKLLASNIKKTVVIAGVLGDYPSFSNPLTASTAAADLPALDKDMTPGSYEYFDSAGNRLVGSVIDGGTIVPGTSDTQLGTSGSVIGRAIVQGDASLTSSHILTGRTIFGVNGSVSPRPSDCTSDGASGCVATGAYPAVDKTNLLVPGNIKSGVSIAGVLGGYPSNSYPLANNTVANDLDFATFDARIKSSATFEWFDSAGNAYTNSGDPDITSANILNSATIFGTTGDVSNIPPDPWDLRIGTTINGVTGALKTSCRNGINSAKYNYDGLVSALTNAAVSTGTSLDIWDTVDDFEGYPFSNNFPSTWSTDYQCGGTESTPGDKNVWKDVTAAGGGCTASVCRRQDKITKLEWTAPLSPTLVSWSAAVKNCDNLANYDGHSDWRLPTQRELAESAAHGIGGLSVMLTPSAFYWSSTTSVYFGGGQAWAVELPGGTTSEYTKSSGGNVLCVRP